MKSKIIIYSMSILSLFLLGGCANKSDAQSLTALENQVKRVESIVTTSSSDDISSVSPSTFDLSGYNSIQIHKANSYNNMTKENQLKQEVLSLNSTLKSCLQDDLKLGKTKSSALKTLTSNISENLSKYNNTKSEVKKTVKNINKSLKVPNINTVNAESEYITLNGNMSERYVYLCNIYDNLEQAYILICDCCPDDTTITEQTTQNSENKVQTQQSEVKESTGRFSRFKKNIDSYAPSTKSSEKQVEETKTTEENESKDIRNIDTFTNYKQPVNNRYNINNGYNIMPYNYGYNNMPINGGYNYNYNGYNGYAYNNGYGYANGLRRFNPNRNTDSFYPYNRNIDTYRVNPNLNYPVSGNPVQNEEENNKIEVKENGVIELETTNVIKDLKDDTQKIAEDIEANIDEKVNDGNEIFDEIKQGA